MKPYSGNAITVLDNLIGWIWPEQGMRRIRARATLQTMKAVAATSKRGFDGAKKGSRAAGWQSGGGSVNAELTSALGTLRNRSRDLVRNNGYIKHALSVLVGNIVGTGIVPKFSDPTLRQLWMVWSRRDCDAGGLLSFSAMQAQIVRAMWESGECLVRFWVRPARDGMQVPLQLQVIESDFLDISKTGAVHGGFCLAGVQFNHQGQRVGYWLFDHHPGEIGMLNRNGAGMDAGRSSGFTTSRFVKVTEVLHLFDPLGRPGQVRGLPELAVSIWKARDLDDYQEAELIRKKIEACFAVFVTTPDNEFRVGREQASPGPRIEGLSPGMVDYLKPGESVNFAAPASGEGYEEHVRIELRAIAAGTNITYEQLTGDYSQVNFTSGRMGKMEFKRMVEQFQWLIFIPMFCDAVAQRFARIAYLAGELGSPHLLPDDWTAPRIPLLDPLREGQGYQVMRELNVMSRQEIIRELGYDPDMVDAEIAIDPYPYPPAMEKVDKKNLKSERDVT